MAGHIHGANTNKPPKVMRVVTWNCNGAFRRKRRELEDFDADVLVIQECEDPSRGKDTAYRDWACNYLWSGDNQNRGLGVFAKSGVSLKRVELECEGLRLFLPCVVGGDIPLLGVWTMRADSKSFGYIGQLWKFLQLHKAFLQHPAAVVAGDLNSNKQWDAEHRGCSHSDVVKELSEIGLESSYHHHLQEDHGSESQKTFFLHRNLTRPYHIDYVFRGSDWRLRQVKVGAADRWLSHSDHMPVVVELERLSCGEPNKELMFARADNGNEQP